MRIGEIVETDSVSFVAESDLHRPPALGSLVKTDVERNVRLYGIVAFAQTSGLQPGRRAFRRGTEGVYDGAIYEEHPELRRTLRTVFQSVLVGWEEEDRLYQRLPAQPPPLHYSVQDCSAQDSCRFSEKLYYLRLLLTADVETPEPQLIVAHVNQTYRLRGDDRPWLDRVARELAALLKGDNDKLMSILHAIDPDG